jgi:hypothetical protein
MPSDKERVLKRLAALLLGTSMSSSFMVEAVYAQVACNDPAALAALGAGTEDALLQYLAKTPTGPCADLVNAALLEPGAGSATTTPPDPGPGPNLAGDPNQGGEFHDPH